MAIYNEILSARFSRMIQKLLSMKGQAAVRQVSGELMPTISFFNGVENRFLEGWNRFQQWFQVAAGGAGTNGAVRMRNPAGSGVVIVIESVIFTNLAAATDQLVVQQAPTNTDLATLIVYANQRMDARTNTNPTMISSQQAAAALALGNNKQMICAAPNVSIPLIQNENQELTILPGDAVQLIEGGSNQQFTCSVVWRERAIEESEKQF